MKNKGFTLIEIIIVIAILSIVGTVITISLTKTLHDANQKQCDGFVKKIEDAASAYTSMRHDKIACNGNVCTACNRELASKNGGCKILLSKLISEGFVEDEKDACTGEAINENATITITWNSSGEKICHYDGVREYER